MPPRYLWDFRKCDWPKFAKETDAQLGEWLRVASRREWLSVDELYDSWLSCLLSVVHRFIRKRKLTQRSRAFWTPEIKHLVAVRRQCLRASRRDPTTIAIKRYKEAHRASREAIRAAKEKLTRLQASFLTKAGRNQVFKRFRTISRSNKDPVPELMVNGKIQRSKKAQVEAFNGYFARAGEEQPEDAFDNEFKAEIDEEIATHGFVKELKEQHETGDPISRQEVEGAIGRLGANKAPGPDGIHPQFLKEGGPAVATSLQFVFNFSYRTGTLAKVWKVAYISPLRKKRARRSTNSDQYHFLVYQ